MRRPVNFARSSVARRLHGFTIMELLVATGITLMLLVSVVQLFAWMSTHIDEARCGLEMQDHLRSAAMSLQTDLKGVTVTMNPPRRPEDNEGYFEYVEGGMGVGGTPDYSRNLSKYKDGHNNTQDGCRWPVNSLESSNSIYDATVGDTDDILMFTTRSTGAPFVGQIQGYFNSSGANIQNTGKGDTPTIQSSVAEVIWFVRYGTLFRRQLLVAPFVNAPTPSETQVPPSTPPNPVPPGWQPTFYLPKLTSSYLNFDVSMHTVWVAVDQYQRAAPPIPQSGVPPAIKTNTLGDLTKREYRYGHPHWTSGLDKNGNWTTVDYFPYDISHWGDYRLPTLRESAGNYFYPNVTPGSSSSYSAQGENVSNINAYIPAYTGGLDYWTRGNNDDSANLSPLNVSFPFGTNGSPEDVILTYVIGFDVKIWDPGAPIYQYIIPATGTTPARTVSLAPGDPGWMAAACAMAGISPWSQYSNKYQWVGCGAFVDLGYGYYYYGGTTNPLQQPIFYPRITNNSTATAYPNPLGVPVNSAGLPVGMNHPPNPAGMPQPHFDLANHWPVNHPTRLDRTYDTWSTHYAMNAPDEDPDPTHARAPDQHYVGNVLVTANDGFDDDGLNGPDDLGESMYAPPHPYPLRAIQVKIRAFEPSSRQIREVTVTQDFLPR